jgi:hypothetical protein
VPRLMELVDLADSKPKKICMYAIQRPADFGTADSLEQQPLIKTQMILCNGDT